MTIEEAFFHQITKCLPFHLSKRQQTHIMRAFREALYQSPAHELLFKVEDRIIVVDPGEGNDVVPGSTGTILSLDTSQDETLAEIKWDHDNPRSPGTRVWPIYLKRVKLLR